MIKNNIKKDLITKIKILDRNKDLYKVFYAARLNKTLLSAINLINESNLPYKYLIVSIGSLRLAKGLKLGYKHNFEGKKCPFRGDVVLKSTKLAIEDVSKDLAVNWPYMYIKSLYENYSLGGAKNG